MKKKNIRNNKRFWTLVTELLSLGNVKSGERGAELHQNHYFTFLQKGDGIYVQVLSVLTEFNVF